MVLGVQSALRARECDLRKEAASVTSSLIQMSAGGSGYYGS